MGFFTVGNLLTLGIALLFLVLFRYLDKNNRHMKGLRDYSDILKKDLASFMEEHERAIKDYGISLNVERESAKELMKRLLVTEEELAEKAATMARIDSQIKSYESSLVELDRMTSRVQENMNRIREESAFVESTGKRLNEAKNRLDELRKELGALESKFEQKNTEALEKSVDSLLSGVKTTVAELSASAETIERQVNDHRHEIDKIEDKRATDMARDLEHINHILKTAVEQAGERAGKIEEAALANLKEQAEDRIRRLKTAEEERLKGYQESAKARVAETQVLLKKFQEEWEAERTAWENKDNALRDQREKDIQELNAALEDSQLRLNASLADSEKRLSDSFEDSESRLNAAKANFETQMREFAERTDKMIFSQEAMLLKTAEEMRQKSLEMTGDRLEEYGEKWQAERAVWEDKDMALRDQRAKDMQEFNAAFEDSEKRLDAVKADIEAQMQELSARASQMVSSQEAMLFKTAEEMRQKSLEMTGARLEEYGEKWQAERAAWENKDKALRDQRTKDMQELSAALEDSEKRLDAAKADIETQMLELSARASQMVSSQEAMLFKAAEEMRQKSLEMTGARLEEYSGKWQAERAAWENKDISLRDQRAKDMQELSAALEDAEKRLNATLEDSEKRLNAALENSEKHLSASLEDSEKRLNAALEDSEKHLNVSLGDSEKRLNVALESSEKHLNASLEDSEKRLNAAKALFENQMQELSVKASQTVSSQEAMLVKSAEDMKHKALEITETKLEEYRHAQEGEFRRLETLADDSRRLDAELRRSMQEVINRAQEDFSRYEQESANIRKAEFDKFSAAAVSLRKELAEIEKELETLRSAAHDNVSGELKSFEDSFFADLSKRSGEIDQRLMDWQDGLETRLSRMGEEAETGRRELERGITEEMRKHLAAQDARLVSSLERLKEETSAFGERIQGEMNAADESVTSLKEQLADNFEEARKDAEVFIKAEIGKHSLAAAETIKQYQRELDGKLREMTDYIQTRNSEISLLIDASRADLAEAKDGIAGKVRELDNSIEDARRRVRDLTAETDTRIASVRSSVEDTERHIREAVDQTKLIDRAEALRLDLARRIEDLKSDMDRLDQRKAEAAQLENDFVKIKRLEDDVNAKMTRFLSERRKIETMEADFNRLLKISGAVEEKLTQVTTTNDSLQGMELQLRRLEEALGTTEEKFQRIDRKNQILDNTNDGIDRNFRVLQESEKLSARIGGDLERYAEDLSSIKTSIEKLSGESEKARQAVDKIEVLDELLEEIEGRIKSMQGARQSVAGLETRLEELNRQAQTQARAIDGLMKGKKSATLPDLGPGAPPMQKKENVISLAKQGWKVDEIAKAMKISRGEVELILEMTPLD